MAKNRFFTPSKNTTAKSVFEALAKAEIDAAEIASLQRKMNREVTVTFKSILAKEKFLRLNSVQVRESFPKSFLFKLLTVNIRGFANPLTHNLLFDLIESSNCDACLVQETLVSSESTIKSLSRRWLGCSFWSPASSRQGCVVTLISSKCSDEIVSWKKDSHGCIVSILIRNNDVDVNLVNIYPPTNVAERKIFFHSLHEFFIPSAGIIIRCNNILDLVLTTNSDLINNLEVGEPFSDHNSITFIVNTRPYQQRISTKENYAFNKADWSHLRSLFSYSPWYLTLEQQEINVNWEVWKDLYFTVVNKSIPKYWLKRKNIAPWMTKDLIKLSRKKKHLYKRAKKAKKSNSEDHLVAYCTLNNTLKKKCNLANWSHLKALADKLQVENNSKPFWNYMRSIRNCSFIFA